MQILIKGLILHPSVSGFSLLFVALVLSLLVSLWGGWKLFSTLAEKSRRGALSAAFIWYAVLFVYFSLMLSVLPFAILIDLGVSEYEIGRLHFAVGDYPLIISFFVFLIGGAVGLFVFIKKKAMLMPVTAPISLARALWSGMRKGILLVVLVFLALVIVRMFHFANVDRTDAQVAKIHATKLTLDDVLGQHLPPDPGAEADKTIQGVDANHNGIRDDVELAIFKEYPNSAKTRAVLLQYALALQAQTTLPIVNKETVTEVITENSRAGTCVSDTLVPRKSPESSRSDVDMKKIDQFISFVENKQLNTDARKKADKDFYEKLGSYSDSTNKICDLDLSTLPN